MKACLCQHVCQKRTKSVNQKNKTLVVKEVPTVPINDEFKNILYCNKFTYAKAGRMTSKKDSRSL